MKMKKLVLLLKAFQLIANIFMIVISVITLCKTSGLSMIVLNDKQLHTWIFSFASKQDLEQLISAYQKSLFGMRGSILLLARWVLCISILSLGLMIFEHLIDRRIKPTEKRNQKSTTSYSSRL